MLTKKLMSLIALMAFGFTLSAPGSAHAWGCYAKASNGAYGNSTKRATREEAEREAIRYCNQSSRGNACVIQSCDQYK